MWIFDNDYNKWSSSDDNLVKNDFDLLKQELSSVRFYSKCLSGSAYLPMNNLENIYDILGNYKPRNWYIGINGSQYSNSLIPTNNPTEIKSSTSYDYYDKYLNEYGLTLKNLFTPDRLIKDSIDNYIYVDVSTVEKIYDLTQVNVDRIIDGIRLLDGHRVLIKDQTDFEVLSNLVDPSTYFLGNYKVTQNLGTTIEYEYYTNENGIYKFENGILIKESDLDDYENCIRFSVIVKLGSNKEKQFHLSRLLNGYYPTSSLNQPVEFIEKKNWILRNRMDYNNLFEINYYDVIKHNQHSYEEDNHIYTIPERIISIGEFGVILNNQNGTSNIINNKYKVNLRSISQTSKYYWICGDDGILLRVRKHDFNIKRIEIDCNCPNNKIITNLKSISFYDDKRGVLVGELNTILITDDGGNNWNNIRIPDFNSNYYNKAIYYKNNKIFIVGDSGIFLELVKDIGGWTTYKKRISQVIDDEDEYLLVDNINDIYYTNINSWNPSYSFGTQSTDPNKELLFIVTDDSKVIIHDINNSIPGFDFIYLDISNKFGDIRNIIRSGLSNKFYFTGINESNSEIGLFSFSLNGFISIGVDNEYSNTIPTTQPILFESDIYSNRLFDYVGSEIIICGNESILKKSNYTTTLLFNELDLDFESKLKSKMLFLDYDMGSKLNFFTDDGKYRLPNSISLDPIDFITGSNMEFKSIINVGASPSYMTQSETSWLDYWVDRYKTFEFYATASMGENTKVLLSHTFSQSNIQSELLINSVTKNLVDIKNLAPNIDNTISSRFIADTTSIIAPSVNYDLYLYDYLMIIKTNLNYSVDIGDIISLESSVVNGEFLVNKIVIFGSDKFIYVFTEFNQNIINELVLTTNSIKITNLNKYLDISELSNRFNKHPISNGYEFITKNDYNYSLNLDFSNGVSYVYNNWTVGNTFIDNSPIIYPSLETTSGSYSVKTSIGNNIIETPIVLGVSTIKFTYKAIKTGNINIPDPINSIEGGYSNGTHSTIKVSGFSSDTSTWEELNSYIMPLGDSYINNGIEVDLSIFGNYNQFRFDLYECSGTYSYNTNTGPPYYNPTVSIASNSFSILIDDIKLMSKDELIVDQNSYGLTYSNTITYEIDALFNNLTSYYNLSTNVITNGNYSTMSYTNGFLKFGYTPTYNILDYLESLNNINDPNPLFYADKDYNAMPDYRGIPMNGVSSISNSTVYIDYNGVNYGEGSKSFVTTGNKIFFGIDLKLEWESIFINTFVDINLYEGTSYITPTTTTNRLLVMKKYYDESENVYVIEFHKKLNFTLGAPLYFIDIISRRKLHQISSDLQELNNIQRLKIKNTDLSIGQPISNSYDNFDSFERELNFKIPTDSYAKILLSDVDTIQELSSIFYIDYKNELAVNMTRLEREYNVPILTTSNFSGNLFIICGEKHNLRTGDSVVLNFTGDIDTNGDYITIGSSKELNPQYFGYHSVTVVNQYNLIIDTPYGTPTIVGNDRGFINYIKKDPFLNYQPVDIIDVGVDKKGKRSIELSIDNLNLIDDKYKLSNVDFNNYRFRLVDGLNIEQLSSQYPWILEAEISDAVIGLDLNGLVWYSGTWECGRWFGGTWYSGTWKSGDWYDGIWYSKAIKDNYISVEVDEKSSDNKQSNWYGGRWYSGTWNAGLWINGRWYGGTWNDGIWYKGIWNDGTWNNGTFGGGVWVSGTWNNGLFNTDNEPSYWLDGEWFGGDFENGMWYNGSFESKNFESRFGVKSYNSRTSNWHGGKWISGSFHSKLNLDVNGDYDVSDTHKYSIWRTGSWFSGDFYGGIVYNIDFKSGKWHGGILDDIQVIGFGSDSQGQSYFMLNGIFKFNIGDEINIIDNQIGNSYSTDFGSNNDPGRYTILKIVEDNSYKWTKIYINKNIIYNVNAPVDLGLRVVSRFRFCEWKSGIWTNGIFDSGLWEGGIWYNGVFGDANWM